VKHGPQHSEPDLTVSAGRLDVRLSTEAALRLGAFEGLLMSRAMPAGLVAASDHDRIRTRHVLDCLRATIAVRASDSSAYDLGSGAGLPGIVIACARPDLVITLVEPRRRAVAFLELAVERLELGNVRVRMTRIEDLDEPVDLCFARAFAALPEAWAAAFPRLRASGRLVYFAGAGTGDVAPLPGTSEVHVVRTPVLESAGPLVIMAR
jgi:16S rRNA (guanine527-N7)-methyltransferase